MESKEIILLDDSMANNSRNELLSDLFNTLKLEWDPEFKRALNESLESHIVSDTFARKAREEREEDLFRLKKVQRIIELIEEEVSNG